MAVAFHAGNLTAVAKAIRDVHPQTDIPRSRWCPRAFAPGQGGRHLSDGQQVAAAGCGPSQSRLLASLSWLANHARDRGMPLRCGQPIVTIAPMGP